MKSSIVVVGTVGAPFGIQGWMHVRSSTRPPGNILAYRPWQLRQRGPWRTVDAEARAHHGGFIARLADVTERNAAALLSGAEIGVAKDVLPVPDADEHYWSDLIGSSVCNLAGEDLGRVSRMLPTPAHDVLVIDDAGRERLIPFVRDAVREVDAAGGRVVVDWQREWL